MKRYGLYILLAVGLIPCMLHAQEKQLERPKVAVVLSGGGAKGVAHIGALRVIERAGIPIDMIVGTSMGSIVGALYSIGYTTDQLDSMVMSQNWSLLLSNRPKRREQTFSQKESNAKYILSIPFGKKFEDVMVDGLINGTNLEMLFNDLMVGYHDSTDFNTMPIPFACVAANIVDGSEIVFHEGVLPVALRASMAIPGAFSPVYAKDMVLVDGGIINNFPTDIAMQMGADIIIGVDVQSALKNKDELSGASAILGQIIDLTMQQRTYNRNVNLADVYMKVNVDGYSSASFNLPALDTLIRRGYEAAITEWDGLLELKARIGIDDTFENAPRTPYSALNERGEFHVYNISFGDLAERQKKWLMRKSKMSENSKINASSIQRCVSMLVATQSYSDIYYTLIDSLDGYNLCFHMDRVKGGSINVGVNFDSEEIASVLLNGTLRLNSKGPSKFSLTGRFGKRIAVNTDLLLFPSQLSYFNIGYGFQHNDIYINDSGHKLYNSTFNYHTVSVGYNDMNFIRQSLKFSLGIRAEHFFYRNTLSDFTHDGDQLAPESEGLVSYFGQLQFETLDNRYFPHRGTFIYGEYNLYTDNFVQFKGHSAFSTIAFSWATTIPVSNRFSLTPSIYGRIISGADIPFSYLNMIGGKSFGRYLSQQMPFDGVGYMEAAPHTFLSTKLKAQQRIGRRHYVMASINYGLAENDFFQLINGNHYFGASIDYGYDSRMGPLMVSFGWSNVISSLAFYMQLGFSF